MSAGLGGNAMGGHVIPMGPIPLGPNAAAACDTE